MCGFQVLVETVPLRNELLLPLSESLLLHLDLLGESLPQGLLFLLELGVVQLPGTSLAELPRLHLLCTVGFVVLFLGGMDQIQHVGTDENRTQLLEVTMVLVLNFSNTPGVLATLDNPAIVGLDVLLGTNHGVRHSRHQAASVGGSVFVVFLNRRGVDLDTLGLNNSLDLVTPKKVSLFPCTLSHFIFFFFSYPLLVPSKVGRAQSVCLGNDRDQVDTRAQALHDLNVEGLQGVSGGPDKVQTGVHTHVNLLRTARLLLLQHIRFMLVVKEFDNGLPGVAVVDVVSETRGINDGQTNCIIHHD